MGFVRTVIDLRDPIGMAWTAESWCFPTIGIVLTGDVRDNPSIETAWTVDVWCLYNYCGIVRTTHSGDCPMIGIVRTIDASCFLFIGMVRTNDLGDCLLVGIVLTNYFTGCLLIPFRTAAPFSFWGQTTRYLCGLSLKRDCGPRRVTWNCLNNWFPVMGTRWMCRGNCLGRPSTSRNCPYNWFQERATHWNCADNQLVEGSVTWKLAVTCTATVDLVSALQDRSISSIASTIGSGSSLYTQSLVRYCTLPYYE